MYLQKWNQQLIILFIHVDFSLWLISLVVGVINFISNTDYSGTFRQALVELLISNLTVSLTLLSWAFPMEWGASWMYKETDKPTWK